MRWISLMVVMGRECRRARRISTWSRNVSFSSLYWALSRSIWGKKTGQSMSYVTLTFMMFTSLIWHFNVNQHCKLQTPTRETHSPSQNIFCSICSVKSRKHVFLSSIQWYHTPSDYYLAIQIHLFTHTLFIQCSQKQLLSWHLYNTICSENLPLVAFSSPILWSCLISLQQSWPPAVEVVATTDKYHSHVNLLR